MNSERVLKKQIKELKEKTYKEFKQSHKKEYHNLIEAMKPTIVAAILSGIYAGIIFQGERDLKIVSKERN